MVDILHTMFEEDFIPRYEQEMEVKGKIRESIARNLYDEEYTWGVHTSDSNMAGPMLEEDDVGPRQLRPAPRYQRMPSGGLGLTAVNPETGTMELPEGTKRADPAKRLPRVQSATSMEDLSGILGTPLG